MTGRHYIPLFYILSLLNASVSYFFAYKSTLLLVDQRKYIETTIRGAVSLAAALAQILVLYLTGSYLYYLLLSIGATLAQNIIISARSNQLYPFLKEKKPGLSQRKPWMRYAGTCTPCSFTGLAGWLCLIRTIC